MSPARGRWVALALGGAALLIHLAALGVPFVYDDGRTVTHNPSLAGSLSQALAHERFRPLTNLSYYADAAAWGVQEPFGFHLTSLLLHGLAVALLFLVAWDGGRARVGGALVAAAALGAHPLFVQAVGYVSGRSGVWVAVWLLAGLLAYRRAVRQDHAGWLVVVGGCWVLAAASKETGAMLPALLLLDDALLADDPGRGRRLRRLHLPALGLLALGAALRLAVYVGQERGGAHGVQTVLTQLGVSWRTVRLFVAPLDQAVVHLIPQSSLSEPGLWLRLGALLGLPALIWRLRRRAPRLALGLAWYAVLLAPTTLVPLDEHLAEQRAYVPGLGLCLALGAAWGWAAARFRQADARAATVAWVGAAIWLLGLAGLTQLRYRVWRDPGALWTEAVVRAGPAAELDPRLRHSPIHAVPFNNLGVVLLAEGQFEQAERRFSQALTMRPDYAEASSNRGAARFARGDEAGAFEDYRRALTLQPENPIAATNCGLLLARQGHQAAALRCFSEALQRLPDLGLARLERGKLLAALGRHAEAVQDLERALELLPERRVAVARELARSRAALERE